MIRRLFTFYCVVLLCCAGSPAHAQFWKKWFKKSEDREPHRSIHKTAIPPKEQEETKKTVTAKKKHDIEYPATKMKHRYRVDVFAALYLDELIKNDKLTFKEKIPENAVAGLDFYEGVKIAADTLNTQLYNIDVYVHDIADVTESPETLINAGRLDSSDLLIGAVPSKDVPLIAWFARKHQINFISALSPSDGGVKNDPYFTQIQPSLQSHCEWIMNTVGKKYRDQNVTLIYRTSVSVDENAYNYLTGNQGDTRLQKLRSLTVPRPSKLKLLFDSTRDNVIVVTVLDNNYADSLLKELYDYFPNYRFEVYGMPTWRTMASLHKPDSYPNVAVYVTEPYYFDITRPIGQYIDNQYKNQFGGKCSEMVYRGYETMYWYANLLRTYGTIFDKNMNDNTAAPFTKFEIKPKWDKNDEFLYNENRHIYTYRYQSGSFIVEQ